MSNSIALSQEQFIFANGEELLTTSLKIAEAFERNHKDVLRAIEKIITQVSDSFGKRNFTPSEYEQENNLGLIVKYPKYELTKDGFMIVVMSFTGEKAMAIKEWYINAFNAMHDKLFPKTTYGLKSLPSIPAPRAKTYVKGGLELHQQDAINDFIKERLENVPEHRRGSMKIKVYSAICTKFDVKGMANGYKNIEPAHFDNIIQLIARLPLDENALITMLKEDFDALVDERVQEKLQALPAPAPLEGEVLPKPTANSVTLTLAPLENRHSRRWLVSQFCNEALMMNALDDDVLVRTREQLIKELRDDNHLVAERTAHDVHDMIMKFTPIQLIPVILEAATTRMQRINWQMPA